MKKDEYPSDEQLLALFNSRSEEAISQTSAKYGRYLSGIVMNVLHNREDCDECLNDVYYSIWQHIPPDCPRSFAAYVTVLARNLALNRRRSAQSKKDAVSGALPIDELEQYLACSKTIEREYDDRRLQELFERFVNDLSEKDRYIFECRYYFSDSVSTLADALRISETAVYKRIHKISLKLKKYLEAGGYYV